jgi:hypothetical protein
LFVGEFKPDGSVIAREDTLAKVATTYKVKTGGGPDTIHCTTIAVMVVGGWGCGRIVFGEYEMAESQVFKVGSDCLTSDVLIDVSTDDQSITLSLPFIDGITKVLKEGLAGRSIIIGQSHASFLSSRDSALSRAV